MIALWLLVVTTAQMPDQWTVTPANPTVGDTVVFERFIAVEDAAARARVNRLESGSTFELLRDPVVAYRPGGISIRHVAAFFETDSVTLPDIELIFPDGDVQVVTGGRATVVIQSILPSETDSLPVPRGSRAPVARLSMHLAPALNAMIIVVVATMLWGVLRRRARARPDWVDAIPDVTDPPAAKWIAAGEPRAVASLVMVRLREELVARLPEAKETLSVEECLAVVERERPDWPVSELADVLHAIERTSFAPAVPHDVLALLDQVEAVARKLVDRPVEVS
jgi:hypothetical protein